MSADAPAYAAQPPPQQYQGQPLQPPPGYAQQMQQLAPGYPPQSNLFLQPPQAALQQQQQQQQPIQLVRVRVGVRVRVRVSRASHKPRVLSATLTT